MCSLDYENFKFLKKYQNSKYLSKTNQNSKFQKMIKILCTVGPSTINSLALKKLEKEKVSLLLRINLSHTNLDDLKTYIETIQSNVNIPICIDSEGSK